MTNTHTESGAPSTVVPPSARPGSNVAMSRSFALGTELLPKSGAGKILERQLREPYLAATNGRPG